MFEKIKKILLNEGILRVGMLDIDECDIINARLLPEWAKSVLMFTIPYRAFEKASVSGFSEYARIFDYHKFSKELYEKVLPKMRTETGFLFEGFCDHSPINEKLAIAKCGLGFIGNNSLFFDDIYGSFVFLGSIITNAESVSESSEIRHCENCGICKKSCPNGAIKEFCIDRTMCLSAISQKKRKTDEEKELLRRNNIAWGCDICQNACPHNKNALISPIEYFKKTRIEKIDKKYILSLSDEEFEKYAFSYRGRNVILENLENIENI